MDHPLRSVLKGYAQALRSWEVWLHLGTQDIKNRYKRSFVGPLWLVVSTATMVVGLGLLFARIFTQGRSFVAFLSVGMTLWGLIASSITDGGYAFIGAESYIKQIPLPKQVYLFRTMAVSLIVFSFSLPVLLGAVLYARLPVGLGLLWALGGVLIVVVCCVGQISIMAYLSVSFRDLPPASNSALQLLYFFTPIFYPVEVLEQRGVGFLLHFNPFYYLIEVVRYPVLQNALATAPVYAGAILWTAIVWGVALLLAARLDRKIAYTL